MVILIGQSVDNYETFKGIFTCLFNYFSIIHFRAHNNTSGYQAPHKSHSVTFTLKCKCIAPVHLSVSSSFLNFELMKFNNSIWYFTIYSSTIATKDWNMMISISIFNFLFPNCSNARACVCVCVHRLHQNAFTATGCLCRLQASRTTRQQNGCGWQRSVVDAETVLCEQKANGIFTGQIQREIHECNLGTLQSLFAP